MSMISAYPYKSETAPEPAILAGLYERFRSDDFVGLKIHLRFGAWIAHHHSSPWGGVMLPAVGGATPEAATFEATTYGSNTTASFWTALGREAASGAAPEASTFDATTYGSNRTARLLKALNIWTALGREAVIRAAPEAAAPLLKSLDIGTALGRDQTYVIDDPLEGYDQYANPNWDGFDAEPITPETLTCARKILRELPNTFGEAHIAPGADGSIGFYWSADKGSLRSLCIDVGPGQKWRAYWQLRDGRFDRLPSRHFDNTIDVDLASLFHNLSL